MNINQLELTDAERDFAESWTAFYDKNGISDGQDWARMMADFEAFESQSQFLNSYWWLQARAEGDA